MSNLDLFSPDPGDFLRSVWGNGPHSLCWADEQGGFHFTFCHSPRELLDEAQKLRTFDVWFGAHPLKGIPAHGRGNVEDVLEVQAIPADLDWDHPTRRTEKQLPCEAEVRSSLARFGSLYEAPPTIVVHSGHGLQAWWVLDRPVPPEQGEQLIAQIGAGLASVGLENGREDLASILRLPGTLNFKGAR